MKPEVTTYIAITVSVSAFLYVVIKDVFRRHGEATTESVELKRLREDYEELKKSHNALKDEFMDFLINNYNKANR